MTNCLKFKYMRGTPDSNHNLQKFCAMWVVMGLLKEDGQFLGNDEVREIWGQSYNDGSFKGKCNNLNGKSMTDPHCVHVSPLSYARH